MYCGQPARIATDRLDVGPGTHLLLLCAQRKLSATSFSQAASGGSKPPPQQGKASHPGLPVLTLAAPSKQVLKCIFGLLALSHHLLSWLCLSMLCLVHDS